MLMKIGKRMREALLISHIKPWYLILTVLIIVAYPHVFTKSFQQNLGILILMWHVLVLPGIYSADIQVRYPCQAMFILGWGIWGSTSLLLLECYTVDWYVDWNVFRNTSCAVGGSSYF